jgi:hypothetical protein
LLNGAGGGFHGLRLFAFLRADVRRGGRSLLFAGLDELFRLFHRNVALLEGVPHGTSLRFRFLELGLYGFRLSLGGRLRRTHRLFRRRRQRAVISSFIHKSLFQSEKALFFSTAAQFSTKIAVFPQKSQLFHNHCVIPTKNHTYIKGRNSSQFLKGVFHG